MEKVVIPHIGDQKLLASLGINIFGISGYGSADGAVLPR